MNEMRAPVAAHAPNLLGQEFLHHSRRVDTSQTCVKTLMPISETLMIDAELIEQCRLEIADMDRVAHDVIGELIGLAVHEPAFEAATGDPQGVATGVVMGCGGASLGSRVR